MITIKELQAAIPGLEDEDLDVVRQMEEAAVAYVETQTRRYFGPRREVTEIVRGTGTSNLWLTHGAQDFSLTDAYVDVMITVDGRQYAGYSYEASTDFDAWVRDGETALVRHNGGVWTKGYEYRVTYIAGYEEGQEPADIRSVVINLVKASWEARDTEGGLKSETLGGYSYTLDVSSAANSLSDLDIATIDAWRRLVVA